MERAGEASVDESANKFLSPGPRQNRDEVDFSENPRWQLESAQIISWELQQDIFQKYTIYLFQHHYDIGSIMGGHIFIHEKNDPNGESRFLWPVTPSPFNLNISEVFFLWLVQGKSNFSCGFPSHAFNITREDSSSTSSLTVSSLLPSSGIVSDAYLTSPTSSTTAQQTSQARAELESSSDNQTKTLGLAIGLSLGVLLLLLAGILVAFKFLPHQRAVQASGISQGSVADAAAPDPGTFLQENPRPMSVPELPASDKAHELASASK